MKIKINFEREFPSPTFSGFCIAAFAVFLGFILKTGYDYFDSKNQFLRNIKTISSDLQESQNLLNVVDAISYSNQLGRLDIISLLLALFGMVIGFGAVFGFLHIKDTSEAIARDVAREIAENRLDRNNITDVKQGSVSAKNKSQIRKDKQRGDKTTKSFTEAAATEE